MIIGTVNRAWTVMVALGLDPRLRRIAAGSGNRQRCHETGKREPMRARDPSRTHCGAPQRPNREFPVGRVNPEFGALAVIGMPQFAEIARDNNDGGARGRGCSRVSARLRGKWNQRQRRIRSRFLPARVLGSPGPVLILAQVRLPRLALGSSAYRTPPALTTGPV